MTDQDDAKRDDLRESWIESLLVSATRRQDHSELIAQAMSRIDSNTSTTHGASKALVATRNRNRFLAWPTFGVAVAVLLALFLLLPGSGNQSAMAAIQRSLDVAAEKLVRKYSLKVKYRVADKKTLRIDNELYVQGNDRFALHHPGLFSDGSFWMGRDGTESWVVPATGPVMQGDDTVHSRYLSSRMQLGMPEIERQNLPRFNTHVTHMLRRMLTRGFELTTLADDEISISNGRMFNCRHIRAESPTSDDPNLPKSIDLWASIETGMAVRVIARWELAEGETGRQSVVLTFQQEEPDLPDSWFSADGHYEGNRTIFGASNNRAE